MQFMNVVGRVVVVVVCVSCGGEDSGVGSSPTAPTSITTQIVASVSVSAANATLNVGATTTVTATATYSDGTSAEVTPTWSSNDESVATVSDSGTVTAVAPGSATITGTFNEQSGTVSFTVIPSDVTVTSLAVSALATNLDVGQTTIVTGTATYSDGISATVSPVWSSSNTGGVTVSSSGTVTAVAPGSTTITGTFSEHSGTVNITVKTPTVTGISVSASTTSIAVGMTASVTATATYSNGMSAEVTPMWASNDENVAIVSDSGTVTGVAVGTATITGSFGGQSDSVDITVTDIESLGTVEVLYDSGTPIAGFQFRVRRVGVTGAGGGTAEATGFTVNTDNNIVLGFSLAGATITAGNGVLVVLEISGSGDACLTDLVISDSSGNALAASVEDCLTISVP